MTEETGNPILKMLEELQCDMSDVKMKLEEHDKRFDRLEAEMTEVKGSVIYSLGLGTSEHLKNKRQDEELDEQKDALDKLYSKVAELLGEADD